MKEEDRRLWIDRINDYRSSGLTAVKWSEDRGIPAHRLRYYINKFNKEKTQNQNLESKDVKWAAIVPNIAKIERMDLGPLKVLIGKATI